MDYRVEVASTAPLRLRFGFVQPADADGPALVPRLIRPTGYFVEAIVRSSDGNEVFRTTRPKAKPKLDPDSAESYLELSPGYGFDALLDLGGDPLPPGAYVLTVTYSNDEYKCPAATPIGELHHTEELELAVSS